MSSSSRKFFVIIVCVFVFILSEKHFTSEALTDAQRKEIESLRAELQNEFDKDEERTMREHGVIVQPGWTQDHKSPHLTQSKVVVTPQEVNEAKRLRDEISKAVTQDIYTPTVGRGHIGADTHIVQELHKQYVKNANNQKKSTMVSASATTEDQNSSETDSPAGPNVIKASSANLEPDIDIRKLQRLELNKRRTKEALVLEFIEEDFSFTQGEHILEWEHILHGGQEYFIGRLEQDLQIVHKNDLKYEPGNLLHIGAPITYLETYSFWNLDQQQQEGIILLATGDKVLWYRADDKTGEITIYWEWVVGHAITGLRYFTADAQDYLVISSNQSSRAAYYALNIYQFDLKNKEFWIAQRMQLSHPCGEVTFLNTGRDFILAVPQNDTAVIYTFNPHNEASGHIRFQQKYSIESEGIEYISAFQMGGRSYLALGGLKPQILMYQQGKLIPKTIFGNNFGLVEFFFPIPVRTYRDDLILLVQHRVDFSTHKLTVLETLIWNGEAFEATVPAPCKLGSHTVHGVGCMLDLQRDAGLKGAALLRRGDEISVIVPRYQAESGLFRLHTKLLAKNSELTDLQEIFDFLKEWVAEQDNLIEQAQAFLKSESNQAEMMPDFNNLKTLRAPEVFFHGIVKQLYVNDYKWTPQDSLTDLEFVMNEIEKLGNEFEGINQRRRRDAVDQSVGHTAEFDRLELDDVFAESLELESLNDEKFFIQNGKLDFEEGILNLVDLEVLETEVLQQNRQAVFDELSLDQNLEFEQINGVPWSDIEENLVFRNMPIDFESLNVEGEVVVEDILNIEQLNSLKFPNDFLWSEGFDNQVITAPKTFTELLAANHVDSNGVINGMDPSNIVSLSDAQDWSGTKTFAHLEVSEILELNGTARGRGVDEFPINPTLEEANTINANCEFANLKVLGPIKIIDQFNEKPLGTLLNDIVQRPVDPNVDVLITSPKSFSQVHFPLDFHVLDDAINNIRIDEFIPAHTHQVLNISKLSANCFFNNLTISGTYDGVKIEELLNNAINITKPQSLPTTQLNFIDVVVAEKINIVSTLNGVPIATGFQTINEDLKLPTAQFETLKVEEANIHGTTQGAAKVNGLEISNKTLDQNDNNELPPATQVANIIIDELILEQGLKVDEIQGINADFLYNFLENIDDLPDMILDGKVHVDHIIVTGNVQVNTLNGQNFDEDIQMTAIWLNRPNYLSTNLDFIEPVDLHSNLVVLGDYNGKNLADIIDDMVFRIPSNGTVLIWAPKQFLEPIKVLGNTKLDALNGVPFHQIASKCNIAHFKGHLMIKGNLHVQDLHFNGSLNGFNMTNITDRLYFDNDLKAFVLLGITELSSPLILNDLTVYGDLNEFEQLQKFFRNIIYKQGINLLNGQYNFTGRVSIERGVYINELNGHRLLDLFNNIIYINGLESIIINSPIHFAAPIKVSTLNVHGALVTDNISGCKLIDWLNDTLRLDRAENITDLLYFAPDSLHGNKFIVNYLNNIDLSKIITLHTPQNLTGDIKFSEILLNGTISANGPINGADLQYEFENTVFTYGDQHIKTPLKIPNAIVYENMETNSAINGDKDLMDVAMLNEDVEFESPLYFEKLQVYNLATEDLISGIDFNEWFEQALWFKGRPNQYITGNWSVRALSLQNGPEMPADILGSARNVRESESDFNELCQQMKQFWNKLNERPYYIKYLEKAFEMKLSENLKAAQETVNVVFTLQHKERNYLLVNLGCTSLLLKWQHKENSFNILQSFETGYLKQTFKIVDKSDDIKFVTQSFNEDILKCNNTGLKLWVVQLDRIEQLKNVEVNATQIWPATNERSFYALTLEGLKQITAREPYTEKTIELDNPLELSEYSFIDYGNESSSMYFTNGTHIIEISQTNSTQLQRQSRSIFTRYNFYTSYPRSIHTPTTPAAESVLKPNETLIRKLSFADLSQVIERILEDLDYRLSIVVNITQLSIPEIDLYDAHLVEDFLAIMQELRSQNIFPPNTFADIDLTALKIPENPAQVLAARTVQIVWPVIVEINEIHRYLQGNTTSNKEHPTSGCILNHLGTIVREVLLLANNGTGIEQQINETIDYTNILALVVQRIRQFQADLKILETEIKLEVSEDLNAVIENEIETEINKMRKTQTSTEKLTTMESSEEMESDEGLQQHLPTKMNSNKNSKNEILKLVVGAISEPRILLAVSSYETQLVPGEPAGLNLYTDFLQNQLFQFIPAHKPRSLTMLRIRDLTFVAFLEHCCLVNVLQYRGVEGFVDFVKFTTNTPVQQLKSISLPKADSKLANYLIVVFKHKLVFYEFVFAGLRNATMAELKACT